MQRCRSPGTSLMNSTSDCPLVSSTWFFRIRPDSPPLHRLSLQRGRRSRYNVSLASSPLFCLVCNLGHCTGPRGRQSSCLRMAESANIAIVAQSMGDCPFFALGVRKPERLGGQGFFCFAMNPEAEPKERKRILVVRPSGGYLGVRIDLERGSSAFGFLEGLQRSSSHDAYPAKGFNSRIT